MTARLAVILLAGLMAFGGLGLAVTNVFGGDDDPGATKPVELRKDDAGGAELVADDDPEPAPPPGDGDRTRGNDGTSAGNNTGDGDRTRGNDGTSAGNNTGDGDVTAGNDGTAGGDNSYVAAPSPGYGGGDSGGGETTG
jgi:hypothetical protein